MLVAGAGIQSPAISVALPCRPVQSSAAYTHRGKVGQPIDADPDRTARCLRLGRHHFRQHHPGDGRQTGAERQDEEEDGGS